MTNSDYSYTLNQVLTRLGYTTRPAGLHRKDILKGDQVVLANATAQEVWDWLNANGEDKG